MILKKAVESTAQTLKRHELQHPRRDAEYIVSHVIGEDRSFLLAYPDYELSAAEQIQLLEWTRKRSNFYPLQYLTGIQEFYWRDFQVSSAVLIPRPETELLAECSLELLDASHPHFKVLDIGTGSGCIVITLCLERPQIRAVATDLSADALEIARRNAQRLDCLERIEFLQGDLLTPLERPIRPEFDLIVSNPPYVAFAESDQVDPSVRKYEPRHAVFSGPTGLEAYRAILRDARGFLKPGGHLVLELGYRQSLRVCELAEQNGWVTVEMRKDLAGIDRALILR